MEIGENEIFRIINARDSSVRAIIHFPNGILKDLVIDRSITYRGPATVELGVGVGQFASVTIEVLEAAGEIALFNEIKTVEVPMGMYMEVVTNTPGASPANLEIKPEGYPTTFHGTNPRPIIPGPSLVTLNAQNRFIMYRLRINPGAPGPGDGIVELGIEESEGLNGPWTESRIGLREATGPAKYFRAIIRN